MKNLPEFKEERNFSENSVDYDDDKIECLCNHGAPCGADDAQFGSPECAENQDVVAHAVRADRCDPCVERELYSVRGAEQRAHGDCQALENVGYTGHPEIPDADLPNDCLVRVEGQDGSRCGDRQKRKEQAYQRTEGQRDSIRFPQSVLILCTPVLRHKKHSPADEAPVGAEHQAGELSAQTDGSGITVSIMLPVVVSRCWSATGTAIRATSRINSG